MIIIDKTKQEKVLKAGGIAEESHKLFKEHQKGYKGTVEQEYKNVRAKMEHHDKHLKTKERKYPWRKKYY